MDLRVIHTELDGVVLVEPDIHSDIRGFFIESYNYERYKRLGIDVSFVQDNHSYSKEVNVIRGLHFQKEPLPQAKLVRVVEGKIMDVVVDIRKNSSTFGKWISVVLDDESKRQLFIPHGFAHGFCTLEPNTHIEYKVDNYYSAEHDSGIIWNDLDLAITWPTKTPILSDKDKIQPRFQDADL